MEETIPATGHDDGEWIVVKEAGLFTEGLKELRCSKDNVVLATETTPQTAPISLSLTIVLLAGLTGIVFGGFLLAKKKKNKSNK